MPRVSIVMSTRNRVRDLERTLLSLRRHYYRSTEVVVVDDGSTDGTWDLLRSMSWLTAERLERRGGYTRNPALGYNRGHEIATGEIFVQQSSDVMHLTSVVPVLRHECEPGRPALSRVVDAPPEQAERIAEMAAATETRTVDVEFGQRLEWRRHRHRVPADPELGALQFCGDLRPVPFLFLGAIHRSDWESMGGYRPEARAGDSDLAARMWDAGSRTWRFVLSVVGLHQRHRRG